MDSASNLLKTLYKKVWVPKGWQYNSLAPGGIDNTSKAWDHSSSRRRTVAISSVCTLAALWAIYWLFHHRRLSETYGSACAREKHVIVASTGSQNVTWMADLPYDWTVKRYMMDNLNPELSVGLPVPRLYGREAMAYMTYIIENYDCLPSYAVFLHGHERSWHQLAPVAAKIRALNLTALDQEKYISLRCEDNMGCERRPYIDISQVNWEGERHMDEFFRSILPGMKSPQQISYKCCGQHAVTASAMRHLSKEQWISVRKPLLREEDEMEANEPWAREPKITEWLLGAWYEKYWHVFFGMDGEHCPSLEQCRQVHFSNAIICDGDTDLVPYEGDTWMDVQCRTAFDGIGRDDTPDWDAWYYNIPGLSGRLREDRTARVKAKNDRLLELEKQFGNHSP